MTVGEGSCRPHATTTPRAAKSSKSSQVDDTAKVMFIDNKKIVLTKIFWFVQGETSKI